MKRNRLFILGIVTVLVALLSLTLVSGTYAKYTSSATGSDSARVAKYLVQYKAGDAEYANIDAANQTLTFNLFDTVLDTKGGAAETNVKVGTGEVIIAPGTKGSFSFKVKNLSEVDVTYALDFTEVQANYGSNRINIEYSLDGSSWTADINTLDKTALESGTGETMLDYDGKTSADSEDEFTIYWQWVFEESGEGEPAAQDGKDTAHGVLAQGESKPTVTVTLAVTFTQVD